MQRYYGKWSIKRVRIFGDFYHHFSLFHNKITKRTRYKSNQKWVGIPLLSPLWQQWPKYLKVFSINSPFNYPYLTLDLMDNKSYE